MVIGTFHNESAPKDKFYSLNDTFIHLDYIPEERILAQHEQNTKLSEEALCAAIECLATSDVICPVCQKYVLHVCCLCVLIFVCIC